MSKLVTNRFYPFILPILTLLVLIHGLRITKQALAAYKKRAFLLEKTLKIDQAPDLLREKRAEIKRIDNSIAKMNGSRFSLTSQLNFRAYLGKLCQEHNVRLDAMPHEAAELLDDYAITAQPVTFQGNIHNILRLMHQLEQKDTAGTITYAHFSAEDIRMLGRKQRLLLSYVKIKRLRQMD